MTHEKSSTKDMVHLRRVKGCSGVAKSFTKDTKLNMKQGTFLSNSTNKQQFINMLSCFLERNCKVYHASGDAGVMNVQKAVELARVADTLYVCTYNHVHIISKLQAPDELLKMIRCNCHTDYSSMRCTCKKFNVKCSSVYGNCNGTGCTNSDISIHEEDDTDTNTE